MNETEYYDEILGPPPEPEQINDLPADDIPNHCLVCDQPTDYWWMYCARHESQVLRDMEPKPEPPSDTGGLIGTED